MSSFWMIFFYLKPKTPIYSLKTGTKTEVHWHSCSFHQSVQYVSPLNNIKWVTQFVQDLVMGRSTAAPPEEKQTQTEMNNVSSYCHTRFSSLIWGPGEALAVCVCVCLSMCVCVLLSSNAPAWHRPFRKLRQLLMRADRSLAEWP